jgi:NADPH:quinone reductase-like Zn-dependent oxidoreductase
METLAELLAAGTIAPAIDRIFPLSETADAFRYIEETHAQGKVVIAVREEN